ncbi:MAG: hypothetical protein ACFFHV_16455 [Promethearchaeota archaeon]
MTLETIVIGIFIIIGILMIIGGIIGSMFLGLILPFAVLLVIGGIALIVLTIIISYILL